MTLLHPVFCTKVRELVQRDNQISLYQTHAQKRAKGCLFETQNDVRILNTVVDPWSLYNAAMDASLGQSLCCPSNGG